MSAQTWLWPNRVIGKRESGVLREEHNAVVNTNATLLCVLRAMVKDAEKAVSPTSRLFCYHAAVAAIALAEFDPS